MFIGIDASRATVAAPTGTETYSKELIRALLRADHENHYRLYTRDQVAPDLFGSAGDCDVSAIPFPRLWTHARLSFEMMQRPPDVLFVPAHVIPLVHPRRSIVTIHDLGQLRFPGAHPRAQRTYHNWSARWNTTSSFHILADSKATKQDLVDFCSVAPAKITVVYPAFDADQYHPGIDISGLGTLLDRFRIGRDYILAIGTIHPRKNYLRLIEAFSGLGEDVDLVIAGKRGWMVSDIFDRMERPGLKQRIHFLDYVARDDMPVLVSGARMLAFPSLHEGFGLPVLEAQACGTPVVCSSTSSFPEVAGLGALLVDPESVDEIRTGMERLLGDESLRRELVGAGLQNVQRFSWERSARQVLDVFSAAQGA